MAVKVFYDRQGRLTRTVEISGVKVEDFPSERYPVLEGETAEIVERMLPIQDKVEIGPEPSLDQRISDLEEALALLHLEVTKVATAGTP